MQKAKLKKSLIMYRRGFYSDRVASGIFGMETKKKCPLMVEKTAEEQ